MNTNVYSFPVAPAHIAAFPTAKPGSSQEQIQRLEQLEFSLQNSQSDVSLRRWLDEYMDIGLELADLARRKNQKVLQESWLKRVYRFLRDTAFRHNSRPIFRHYCLEYLYQPYFALRYVYQSDDNGDQKIRRLNKDLEVIARYVL
ncbi:MAG: hypothetical protein K6L60_09185 [Oceanobacter sp.]|jgi:hypothetical protein